MSGNLRFYANIVSVILFIILGLRGFLGYWTPATFIHILFFFAMIFAILGLGIEIGKRLKNKS